MKLYDPATARELLRLAAAGRNGKAMESPDSRKDLTSLLFRPLTALVYAYIPAGLLGAYDERLRTEHWQTLISCILLMWTVQLGIAALGGPITQNGYHAVFPNLPISGEHAFRWARNRFFREKWFSYLCVSFLCAFAAHGFSFDSSLNLAATTLLLLAMMFSTVQVLQEQWLERFRFLRIWSIGSLLLAGWMLTLLFTNKRIFRIGETPDWMADAILGFTWLLPPSWVLPGRLESGGGILAFAWIGYGIFRWTQWPAAAAPFLDRPRDFAGSFGDFASDEEMEDEDILTASDRLEPKPEETVAPDQERGTKKGKFMGLPSPLAISRDGWVERWVLRWIPKSDEPIAGAFCDPGPSWTTRANWTLRTLPLWLAVIWLFIRFFPESNWKETITIWIWIISIILPFVGLMPISNAISPAYVPWYFSGQSLPFFSAMPVSTRTLLRISMRITIARCILMALIGTPYGCILMAVLVPEAPLLVSVWLVPALCCFWVTARPIFVYYRLQKANRRKRGGGVLVGHNLLVILNTALAGFSFLLAIFAILSGYGYTATAPQGHDAWFLPLGAGGGLLLSAVCSRAVFEIYHWQLKRRYLDWMSSE